MVDWQRSMQPILWASRKIGASFFNGRTSWVVFLMAAEQVTKMLPIEDGDMIHVISANRADGCRPTSGFNPVDPPGELAAYSARRNLKLKNKDVCWRSRQSLGACRPSGPGLIEAASFCETACHRGELMAAKTWGPRSSYARRNEAQVQEGGGMFACTYRVRRNPARQRRFSRGAAAAYHGSTPAKTGTVPQDLAELFQQANRLLDQAPTCPCSKLIRLTECPQAFGSFASG